MKACLPCSENLAEVSRQLYTYIVIFQSPSSLVKSVWLVLKKAVGLESQVDQSVTFLRKIGHRSWSYITFKAIVGLNCHQEAIEGQWVKGGVKTWYDKSKKVAIASSHQNLFEGKFQSYFSYRYIFFHDLGQNMQLMVAKCTLLGDSWFVWFPVVLMHCFVF